MCAKYINNNNTNRLYKYVLCVMQIADFGMARDITDSNYYVTKGGKIPAKWTPPEVLCSSQIINHQQ